MICGHLRRSAATGGAALADDISSVATLQALMTAKQEFLALRSQTYMPWAFIPDEEDVETLAFLSIEEMKLNETGVPVRLPTYLYNRLQK